MTVATDPPGPRQRTPLAVVLVPALGLALAPAPRAGAQAAARVPGLPDLGAEWRWVDFGAEAGLPAGGVQEMVEVDTVPWVRAATGVAWYDGFQWRPATVDGVPLAGQATSLALNGTGVLVVEGGRVYRGDVGGFAPVAVDGLGPRDRPVRAIPIGDGTLILTTDGAIPAAWRVRDGRASRIEGLPRLVDARSLWLTRAGHAWLDTREGVWEWTGSTWVARDPLKSADRLGSLVVEGPSGLGFLYRGGHEDDGGLFRFRDGGPLAREAEEGDNVLWSGDVSASDVAILAYETGDVRAYSHGAWHSLTLPPSRGSGVRFVHISPSGDLWFGSGRGLHLYRRSRSRWSVIRAPFPSPTNRINGILVDRDTSMWLATGGGVLRHSRSGASSWMVSAGGVPLAGLTGIAQGGDGSIWLTSGSTFQGAVRWSGKTWTHLGTAEGLDVGHVHRVFTAPDGTLWMASLGRPDGTGAGVYRRLADGTVDDVTARLRMPRERTYAVAWGPEGTTWVAGAGGLHRIRGDSVRDYPDPVGAAGDRAALWDVAVDGSGHPWVAFNPAGSRGIGFLDDDGSFRSLLPPGPDAVRRVWSLLFDVDGSLWVGTEGGVLSYRDGTWARFDEATGLPSVNVWPLALHPDDLLIGTKGGGLVAMNRGEAHDPPPRLVVDRITVDRPSATLRFAALSYWGELPASAVEARHRLDGGAWTGWSTSRQEVFGNLGPGSHTVEVQAKGLYGQLSAPEAATFQVPLPLPLRPGFALPVGTLLVLLAATGVAAARRRRRHGVELMEREERLRELVETAPDAIGILDMARRRFVDANENALALLGLSRERLPEVHPERLGPARQPDGTASREMFLSLVDRALAGEVCVSPWTVVNAAGEAVPCEIRLARLTSGRAPLVRVSLVDMRESLAAERRRAELEEQLRQSQKLEAVGQLTGGVAHDFNNLLTVIRGNLELLDEETHLDPESRGLVTGALEAAERSARLTQRLLAFSRRQTLAPEPLDPRSLLHGLEELFRRSLGETIRLAIDVHPGTWEVLVDRAQLENALLNLVVNARDAMPAGGTIVIEACNVPREELEGPESDRLPPGDYVRLSVVDDGTGMSADVLDRVFDPFFTTKPVGKGTGLGLSMVYGFIAQSGGTVTVDSVVSEGTAVNLVLPRAEPQDAG
jgi:PAS domain S-box-containing protein